MLLHENTITEHTNFYIFILLGNDGTCNTGSIACTEEFFHEQSSVMNMGVR